MRRPELYKVNAQTHKQWVKRRQLIGHLASWVFHHLDPCKRPSDEPVTRRYGKAHQYVYEHFAIGKMKYPLEGMDPFFTHAAYVDSSMANMLREGLYPVFQQLVWSCIGRFEWFNPDSVGAIELCAVLRCYEKPVQAKITELRARLRALHPAKPEAWHENQTLGLILRYECMGGFTDNLHGSVPAAWSQHLGPDACIECFASPFNHKFTAYHSLYSMDSVFGSRGNFFEMVARARGGLLPAGSYEMNPPWNNEMYEELVAILGRSIPVHAIQAIIVGPNWPDAAWCGHGLSDVVLQHEAYARNSFQNVGRLAYVNDAQGGKFSLDTAYWVICPTGEFSSHAALEKLRLFRPGREPARERRRALPPPPPPRRQRTSIKKPLAMGVDLAR